MNEELQERKILCPHIQEKLSLMHCTETDQGLQYTKLHNLNATATDNY